MYMKNLLSYIISLLVLPTLFSCTDSEVDAEFVMSLQNREPQTKYTLSVSQTDIEFPAEGSTKMFSINSNDSWMVSGGSDWMTFTPSSGEGAGSISVDVKMNQSTLDRTGSLVVSGSKSGERITITIRQGSKGLAIDKDKISVGSEKTTEHLKISTSQSWKVSSTVDWISFNANSGSGSFDLSVEVAENPEGTDRKGYVLITGDNFSPITIEVTQDGAGYRLRTDVAKLTFGSAAASKDVVITSNDSWTVSTNDSWISVSPDRGAGNGTVRVSVSKNAEADRTGSITIKGANCDPVTISVSQITSNGIGIGGFGDDNIWD